MANPQSLPDALLSLSKNPFTSVNGRTTIRYNFRNIESMFDIGSRSFYGMAWTSYTQSIAEGALSPYMAIANITFSRTSTGADLNYYRATELGAARTAGYAPMPGYAGWGAVALDPALDGIMRNGASLLDTAIHETGHFLGLAHAAIGLSSVYDTGLYTIMSYNTAMGGLRPIGLGALDIAAIQKIYGRNTATRAGDDVIGISGTKQYECIWDAGGTDALRISEDLPGHIDLRAATLANGDLLAGGAPSYIGSITNGFLTLANGVVIENAIGAKAADWLRGNEYDNRLEGGAGDDTLIGDAGADTLIGGDGRDVFTFTGVNDVKIAGRTATDYIADFNVNDDKLDFREFDIDAGPAVTNRVFTYVGAAGLRAGAGAQLFFDGVAKALLGDVDGDGREDFRIALPGVSSLSASNFILDAFDLGAAVKGGAGADSLSGTANPERIWAGDGADTIDGAGGGDTLYGGSGSDLFVFSGPKAFKYADLLWVANYIGDFNPKEDMLDLRGLARSFIAGDGVNTTNYIRYLGVRTASSAALSFSKSGISEVLFDATQSALLGDANGDGDVDFIVQMPNVTALGETNFWSPSFVTGTSQSDNLRGTIQDETFFGQAGNDTIYGGGGSDLMLGESGADRFVFKGLSDFRGFRGAEASDQIYGFNPNEDIIEFNAFDFDLGPGLSSKAFKFIGNVTALNQNVAFAKDGSAQLLYDARISTLLGDADGDGATDFRIGIMGPSTLSASNFVNVIATQGTDWNDNLQGSDADETIWGGAGDDRITAGGGWDHMWGGAGADTFVFARINDMRWWNGANIIDVIHDFTPGADKLDFRKFDVDASANVATRTFKFVTGPLFDTSGVPELLYLPTAHMLMGDTNGDRISDFMIQMDGVAALTQNDFVLSDATLQGGSAADTLSGGSGDDVLIGAGGSDHMLGGYGADTFAFKSIDDFRSSAGAAVIDFVDDFTTGVDKLDFRNFDIAAGPAVTTRRFTFIGNSSAFIKDGSAQLMFSSATGKLFGDVNGDGAADFTLEMKGVGALSAADLILA